MGATYIFEPVGLDIWDRREHQPAPGTIVRKVQPPGCPRNGTMGHTFVEPVDGSGFPVLVLTASLRKQRPGS